MDKSLEVASNELLNSMQEFIKILKGEPALEDKPIQEKKKKPEYPGDFPKNNVHKLLRIVWVYVKNSEWDEQDFDQNELEADISSKDFKEKALKALEKLYEVLGEPYKLVSNPCEGAWPRKIRGG